MKQYYIFIALIVIFSGCSSKESIRLSDTTETVCSMKSAEDTYESLLKKLKVYYLGSAEKTSNSGHIQMGGGKSIGMTGSVFLENEKRADGIYEIAFSAKNGISPTMYGFMVLISEGSGKCRTDVKINYMNRFWKRYGLIIKKWLNEETSH